MFLWQRLINQCYFLHDADNADVDNDDDIEIFPEVVYLSVCSRVICCLFFQILTLKIFFFNFKNFLLSNIDNDICLI